MCEGKRKCRDLYYNQGINSLILVFNLVVTTLSNKLQIKGRCYIDTAPLPEGAGSGHGPYLLRKQITTPYVLTYLLEETISCKQDFSLQSH